jgi:exodeoxyribonuclease VII large subunit
MPLETSAEAPIAVRTALRLVGEWIGRLGRVWVEGQIAELSRRGGTVYLTLRDPVAAVSVRVICPRQVFDAADPAPADGARVVVWAKPDFNVARGAFSLSALELRAIGIGELLARLERLRRSLAAEGLFAAERKWPAVRFRVEQVAVQGPFAVEEITTALQALDADQSVDVIIIARGGGSIEDLLPFSDEFLIRAVAACRTPVVSAIGHEQDVPLLDLVADVRASTPTDAARRVVPDIGEQLELISQLRTRARRQVAGRIDREATWLAAIRSRPALASPAAEIDRRHEQVLALAERARRCVAANLDRAAADLGHTRARLIALSPAATLRRGYAIVTRRDATVVRAAADVTAGESLIVRFAEDQASVTVSG